MSDNFRTECLYWQNKSQIHLQLFYHYWATIADTLVGREYSEELSRYSDCLWAGLSADHNHVGATFSSTVHTGTGFKPANWTMGNESFSRGKVACSCPRPPTASSDLVAERLVLYLYSASGLQGLLQGEFAVFGLLLADINFTTVEWLLSYTTSHYVQLYVLLLYSHQSATHLQISQEIPWQLILSCPVGWLLNIGFRIVRGKMV
jgi:hypothetical protein